MIDSWNANNYSQFLNLRTRPARDLLAVIPNSITPHWVYDLGCGPGNSTVLLKDRWPKAQVIGIDSSQDMLKSARANYTDIEFIQQDIVSFSPEKKADVIFSNAALQWLGGHHKLIPRLVAALNRGGFLAIQMPNNFHAPSHQVTLKLLQAKLSWQALLKQLRYELLCSPFYSTIEYYDLLSQSGLQDLQLWETEYFQEMKDHQAIFDWVKGTGLRPILTKMDAVNQAEFAKVYIDAISKHYPMQENGKVLLPFRRLFMVGLCR